MEVSHFERSLLFCFQSPSCGTHQPLHVRLLRLLGPKVKVDMGGSAALLGGFYAAVKLKATQKITLLICCAENAIGPTAFRNDDILTLYSGKTVEINNCDA